MSSSFYRKKHWLVSFIVLVVVYSTGVAVAADDNEDEYHLPFKELSAFSKAYHEIKANYVSPIDDSELMRAAIKGMVESLDKHSKYLSEKQYRYFKDRNYGEYVGVGLSLEKTDLGIEIVNVAKNSPALNAGIKAGMIIKKIDGKTIEKISKTQAQSRLKGDPGSILELTIASSDSSQPETFQLQRQLVVLESVRSQRLPNDIGYIGISQFTLKSLNEFNDAIAEMSQQQQKPFKKLILDLRNNPGGTLDTAIDLCNLFVNKGKIVISKGNTDDANKTYYATEKAPLKDMDVIVVINGGSASASEILASALRDHDKAIILGENSYGKGSIQSIFELDDGGGLKLTSAEYFSPLGHKIQSVGIQPDVVFKIPQQKNPYNVALLDDPQLLQAYYMLNK
jgi:carboxyl-terminal processing protease